MHPILIQLLHFQSGARKPLYPTFPEFVNFLLDEIKAKKELDMHWTPITNFCTPCQVKFNVVAKFETLAVSESNINCNDF